MADLQAELAAHVRNALTAEFGAAYAQTDPLIRPSTFADYQSNVAMALARRLGRPPREVAERIAGHLAGAPMAEHAEVSGPGFINITLRDAWIGEAATAQLGDARLGVALSEHPQRVVVDYSAPNVAKEMHVGHLRTTIVGDAFVRVLERLGHDVIRANHIGDWGTNFGMLLEHLIDIGEEAAYAQLGVTLSDADLAPESFYNPMLDDVCRDLERAGIATMSDGALCAFPAGLPGRDGKPLPLILRKSDGGYGYGTTDMAAIRYRVADLHADRITYVVGSEQSQHLAMVLAVARQAGWLPDSVVAEHAAIGMVTGADKKRFRSRTGKSVKLIDLIDEAVSRAEEVIKDRYDDPELRAQIAEAVGIGALKYADLSVARDSSYTLDFDRMLSLTGNTGPYLQYATARIRSIFRRGGVDQAEVTGPITLGEPAERALALRLLGFGPAVAETALTAEPHRLAGFLFDTASDFTTFFEQCPVLKAGSPMLRNSRLALASLTLNVLLAGLDLLGIPVPDRM